MKKFRKKGFTLVETIVVMLILAILAGMFIPNMAGYIKRTHQTEAIMECRSVVIASQTVFTQTYAYKNAEFKAVYNGNEYSIKTSIENHADSLKLSKYKGADKNLTAVICGLAEAEGTIEYIETNIDCRLMLLRYTAENGVKIEYDFCSDDGYLVIDN